MKRLCCFVLALVLALFCAVPAIGEDAPSKIAFAVKTRKLTAGENVLAALTVKPLGTRPAPGEFSVTVKKPEVADATIETDADNGAAVRLYAVSAGTTKVILTHSSTGLKATVTVKVKPAPATGVVLDQTSIDLGVKEQKTLVAQVQPYPGALQKVTWKCSDKSIASVSKKGLVTGKKAGTATVTVSAKGGFSASCEVTVKGSAPTPTPTPTPEPDPDPEVPKGLVYEIASGEVKVTGYTGSASKINLPGTIEGYPLTEIADRAFADCKTITKLVIPKSVKRMGDSCLAGCAKLESLTIPFLGETRTVGNGYGENTIFGYIFGEAATTDPSIAAQRGAEYEDGQVWPFTVCRYAPPALRKLAVTDQAAWPYGGISGYNKITTVTVENATSLKNNAFMDCSALTSVSLPDKLQSIGRSAFYYCTKLKSIDLPKGLKTIDYGAFWNCENLQAIVFPEGLERIEDEAFVLCGSLKSIMIPKSLTYIGSNVFKSCNAITSFSVAEGNTKFAVQDGVLYCQGWLTAAPKTVGPHVTIPDSATSIPEYIFMDCLNLKSVTITKLVRVGQYAFARSGLETVTLPDGTEYINSYAFGGCQSLKEAHLPASLVSIYYDSFRECPNLTIYAPAGSAGERHAKAMGIPFVAE